MVYKIIKTRYGIFLESLVLTVLILGSGFALGFFVEFSRTNKIMDNYKNYEIEALDLKLQNYYYQIMNRESCDAAIQQNFKFADDLYLRGLEIEKYEELDQITNDMALEKKRYVLLKTELWLNSILLKEKCDDPFDTVVYFYSGNPTSNLVVAEQKVISNVLKTVKEDKGDKIILLPIAGDLRKGSENEGLLLGSVELQMKAYNVTTLPAILINEKILLEGFHTPEEIESYLRK